MGVITPKPPTPYCSPAAGEGRYATGGCRLAGTGHAQQAMTAGAQIPPRRGNGATLAGPEGRLGNPGGKGVTHTRRNGATCQHDSRPCIVRAFSWKPCSNSSAWATTSSAVKPYFSASTL